MSTENHTPEPDLSEFADLVVALEAGRPEPTGEFTEKLDTAVADHFPQEWSAESRDGSSAGFFAPLGGLLDGLRNNLLPVSTGLAALLVVAVVGIGLNQDSDGPSTDSGSNSNSTSEIAQEAGATSAGGSTANDEALYGSSAGGSTSAPESGVPTPQDDVIYQGLESQSKAQRGTGDFEAFTDSAGGVGPNAAGVENRKVAQEAEITLGTKPENVQEVSNEIVDVVDDHNGIVLDSRVTDGEAGEAGARFSLLIPSTQLESAIGDLSGIADLRARNQETEDITAPTLTVEDSLQTARARVESLVGELAEATSDEERAEVEEELGQERRKVARLTTRLNQLERRANLTPVSVRVETGGDTSTEEDDSSWGIGDAIDDAGRMFGIAAGVALIALAVAIPIGILVLIALALNRAWVRRARNRALDEN